MGEWKIKDYCSFDEFCHYILPYRIDHEHYRIGVRKVFKSLVIYWIL